MRLARQSQILMYGYNDSVITRLHGFDWLEGAARSLPCLGGAFAFKTMSKVMAKGSAPHLREDLLTPRFYTTEIAKAARTDLSLQRSAFEAMLAEMEADYNRNHFDRKAPLVASGSWTLSRRLRTKVIWCAPAFRSFPDLCCSKNCPAS